MAGEGGIDEGATAATGGRASVFAVKGLVALAADFDVAVVFVLLGINLETAVGLIAFARRQGSKRGTPRTRATISTVSRVSGIQRSKGLT